MNIINLAKETHTQLILKYFENVPAARPKNYRGIFAGKANFSQQYGGVHRWPDVFFPQQRRLIVQMNSWAGYFNPYIHGYIYYMVLIENVHS